MNMLLLRLTKIKPGRYLFQKVVDLFHTIYYWSDDTWKKNTFLGYNVYQLPSDLWLYQELLFRIRPAFVVQTGIAAGGSLLYFARLLDLIDAPPSALVIGIDVAISESARSLSHPRIRLVEGDSVSRDVYEKIKVLIPAPTGFVVLDSDHSKAHVLKEAEIYKDFVGVGSYLVIEDTNVNGNPVHDKFGPGPFEAAEEFLKNNPSFVRDDTLWQRQLLSFHQYGWLCRTK